MSNDPNTGWANYFKQALYRSQQRAGELENQLALMAKKMEMAENKCERLARCLAQIKILMAKYRIPEEGE